MGRFISEDPIKDGVNWYTYAANNPLRFVDPTGLSTNPYYDAPNQWVSPPRDAREIYHDWLNVWVDKSNEAVIQEREYRESLMEKDPNFGDNWHMFNLGRKRDIFGLEYQEIYNNKMFSTEMVASCGETLRWIEDQITLGQTPIISEINERAIEYLREKETVGTYITPVMYGAIIYGQIAGKTQIKNERTSNTTKGWKVDDPIDNLTKAGNRPAWSTIRQRYWKNEAYYSSQNYSPENITRMQKGLAPQKYNELTGKMESMELHHKIPQRSNLPGINVYDNLETVWPDEHQLIDPYRKTGR